ncbi:NKAP family protein-like [Impatiens glandulifera]|uniref:NKAP family protein-like n=1 Tax=Impatiens glandulifera TaxID=253017 RepID=UPI001FB0E715|nr:NKAP family protein-like [Impatiens glandulifera]
MSSALTMFVKKFGKFMRKNQSISSFNNNNNSNNYKDNIRCFNCDTLGHYKSECRKSRRDDKKQADHKHKEDHKSSKHKKDQKAMLAQENRSKWAQSDSDSNSSSDSDDEDIK